MTTFADTSSVARQRAWLGVERAVFSAPCAPPAWIESGNGGAVDLTSGQPVWYSAGDGKKIACSLYLPGFSSAATDDDHPFIWSIEHVRIELTGGGAIVPANKPSFKAYAAGVEVASATDAPANFAAYSARHFITAFPDGLRVAPRTQISFVITDNSGSGAFAAIYWACHVGAQVALATE